ncbi:MAG: Ig-like domain-containing protein [Deltaproteobacteria bacterium]|nr:Ig-like domain-containing protein [Deltaproteobacteria bacterium]
MSRRQFGVFFVFPTLMLACAPQVAVDDVDDVDDVAVQSLEARGIKPFLKPRPITLEMPWEHARASGAKDTMIGQDHHDGAYAFAGPGQPPLKIFLNRNGGTYDPGRDDSRANTSIVPRQRSTVSAFPYNDAAWRGVVDCVTEQFAAYNVVMVETEPPSNERYVEHVIGGSPGEMGLPNGVGGVAPIDNFNCGVLDTAINFTFAAVYGDVGSICETAAQEIAHSFSLDHEFECKDPMTYLGGCGAKTFQNTEENCGEFEPRACNCNRTTQNSVRIMLEKLGASDGTPVEPPPNDPTPPTVSITSPANNATLLQDSTIVVTATASDNLEIASTELLWDQTGDVFACPVNFAGGAVTCARTGTTSTWNIRVGQGSRTFSVRARDTAGNTVTTTPRTINLAADGEAPPDPVDDQVAPTAQITAPDDGAVLAANSTMQVVATASDETQLASVELLWTFTGDVFPCPFEGQAVSCVQNGSTFTWSLNVGAGSRAFAVRAIDTGGNQAVTSERSIELSVDGEVNPNADLIGEENDQASDAFAIRCGNAIDLVVASDDEDWFAIDAPGDTAVEIGIDAAAGSIIGVELFTADGTQSLSAAADVLNNGGAVRAVSAGPVVLARISTPAEGATVATVSYRLAATCSEEGGDTPTPGSDDNLEENDDAASATQAFCGQEKTQLTAADADFFILEVREGDTLRVALTGSGVQASVIDGAGAVIAGPSADASALDLPAGNFVVKIEPSGAPAFYDAAFSCTPTEIPAVTLKGCGCSADGSNKSEAAGLGLVGLLLLRRRRRA